ncbi:MAG: type II toxin-antitoxin system RelE/ParE family toxin [Gemmataceae bacterium]|nr:type II toxin-antitoxin system RelE/ParE family toxin [Gemmataceae bacterium]
MRYEVSVSPSAKKELDRMPKAVQDIIIRAFDGLAENPRPHGCLKLEGRANQYRIRVGDYRIVYSIDDDAVHVLEIRVRHRKDAYRR